jgi:translation initiation factor 1 (eIF-1/SUI1)
MTCNSGSRRSQASLGIEIQGDQRERIVAELEKLGYKVKRVGG